MTSQTSAEHTVVAVIFDWAGTTVDHGSLAPVEAIRQLFALEGVHLTSEQIRQDMGLHKRDHIRQLLDNPEVLQLWTSSCGNPPSADDAQRLFEQMIPVQVDILPKHSLVLSGVRETVEHLRQRGIKIGSTTGYARGMMEPLLESASEQGYTPDCIVCPEDVGAGRPFPFMIYSACLQMHAYPLWRCVKVGDTVSDIEEGVNAGAWTVGVTRTGNLVGLSQQDWSAQTPQQQSELLESARKRLEDAGADFTIESVADLPGVIDQIEQR